MRASRAEIIAFLSSRMEGLYPLPERQHIARLVAAWLEGVDDTKYLIEPQDVVTIEQIETVAKELAAGRPLQYIIGSCDFCGLSISVGDGVLIPRPETEELVMWAKHHAQTISQPSILDLCTGSGCIALSLKSLIPSASITAVELSDDAISYAKKNSHDLSLDINIVKADVLQGLKELDGQQFDIIISNPPYIPNAEIDTMRINVTHHEPHMALFVPDNDPLLFYRTIAIRAKELLSSRGALFFEIHELLADQTATMLREQGYEITLRHDYFDKPRMICCQRAKL